MKREDIEKAAVDGCVIDNSIFNPELTPYYEQGFKNGAEWRINSVWHKPCDIAEPGKDCLVEHMDGDGNVCICIDWRSEYEWVNACHYDKILRWAYIEDLLPNEQQKP